MEKIPRFSEENFLHFLSPILFSTILQLSTIIAAHLQSQVAPRWHAEGYLHRHTQTQFYFHRHPEVVFQPALKRFFRGFFRCPGRQPCRVIHSMNGMVLRGRVTPKLRIDPPPKKKMPKLLPKWSPFWSHFAQRHILWDT